MRKTTWWGVTVVAVCLGTVGWIGVWCLHRSPRAAVSPTAMRAESPPESLETWHGVEGLPRQLAQFKSVFWEPRDTDSLRRLIRETPLVRGKSILEIGTGTGLIALCCLASGADGVVATDVNPHAIANAAYNAKLLGWQDKLETRLVPLNRRTAFSVVGESERFDLIISNPPWENETPKTIDKYAYCDENFVLLRSLLQDLKRHLNPGGKALLAYGCVEAIKTIQRLGPEHDLQIRVLDDRDVDTLSDVFLPGMLLELTPLP